MRQFWKPLRLLVKKFILQTSGEMRPIPSPKGIPFFGTMLSILTAGGAPKLHLYVDKRHKELGPIYREKLGPISAVFVADGDYMRRIFAAEGKYPKHFIPESWLRYNQLYEFKRGLFFMDGEEWLKFRKKLNMIMLKVRKDAFYQAADLVSANLLLNWKNATEIKDLEKVLYHWSLEVIIAVLLGYDNYLTHRTKLWCNVERLAETAHQIFLKTGKLSLIPPDVAIKLKLPVWRQFVHAANTIFEESTQACKKIFEIIKTKPDESSLLLRMIHIGIEPEDVKKIVADLILAAGDTTANATQWLLHLLSLDPDCQEQIYLEIKHGTKPTENQLLKGALKEALRLCPIAPFITRFMPHDVDVDGYLISANELVLMSLYTSGRSEEYFPDSDTFQPERWTRNDKGYKGVINPNASLPFAVGSRSCIGKKIAETQILVLVAKVLQKYVIKSDRTRRIDIKLNLISVPAERVNILLEPRN